MLIGSDFDQKLAIILVNTRLIDYFIQVKHNWSKNTHRFTFSCKKMCRFNRPDYN